MTVYELIANLTQYPPDATMCFCVGSLDTDSVKFDLKNYATGAELNMELE